MNSQPNVGRPALLFVDHIFHQKTKSSDFLVEILSRQFDIRHIHIDPDAPVDPSIVPADCDHVLLWQVDFLTPMFVAAGKRVVVAQMYDGSAALPDDHWRLNKQARYINFSIALHVRAIKAGAESLLVRYFPDPSGFEPISDYSTSRGFFWQRLPKSDINLNLVHKMFGDSLDRLHVHTPSDDGTPFDAAPLKKFRMPVTRSDWFESRDKFISVLESCNVFIAPRYAEGIGMAFLEAMAKGMVVFAYNLPTHTEYIQNWRNGVLFDFGTESISLTTSRLASMGRAARAYVQSGFERWKEDQDEINRFVLETPQTFAPSGELIEGRIAEVMVSYQRGLQSYVETLKANNALVSVLANWRDVQQLDAKEAPPKQADAVAATSVTLFAGATPLHARFDGWAEPEGSHRWAVRKEAHVTLPVESAAQLRSLMIDMSSIIPLKVTVSVNGQQAGQIEVKKGYQRFDLELTHPIGLAAKSEARVTFSAARLLPVPKVESRPLKFALKALRLNFA